MKARKAPAGAARSRGATVIPQAPGIATPDYAFTHEEAAAVLDVSPDTVDRLTKRGLLRASMATGLPLHSSEELRRFVRETPAELDRASGLPRASAAGRRLGLSEAHI